MGRNIILTDIEWEFTQQKLRESFVNMPNSYQQGEEDALGANIIARFAQATVVADPPDIAEAPAGGVQSDGDFSGEDYRVNQFTGIQVP